jgi:lysozyme
MNMSLDGINLLKMFESFRSIPYKDSSGKPTIGYGHLIKPGEVFGAVSNGQATSLLTTDIKWAEDAVNQLVTLTISQPQFDALVSFTYNAGSGALKCSSLLVDINKGLGDTLAVHHWMEWDKAHVNGQLVTVKGLYNRRLAESTLYSTGDYSKAIIAYNKGEI